MIAYSQSMRRVEPRLCAWPIGIAAIAAAVGGHAAVDLLASLRLFTGTHAAYQHTATVFAATIVGAILLGFAAFSAIGAVIDRLATSRRDHRIAFADGIRRPSASTIALVYGLQIPLLLGLEAVEQIQRFGHPIGVTASLGGPPLVTLAVHAACAVAVTVAVFRGLHAIVEAAIAIAEIVVPLARRLAAASDAADRRNVRARRSFEPVAHRAPLALRIANRPPPHLAAP